MASLRVAQRHGRSVVVEQYSQAPLQLHRPLYLQGRSHPTVYLRTPSAGLLDGDVHQLNAFVDEGSCLELRTQAATLVYPGVTRQTIQFSLGENAELTFKPHPLILAKGARFSQSVRIDLSASAILHYADSWAAGRIAMGECWEFESFANKLEIFVENVLVFRENWEIKPIEMPLTHPLLCGDRKKFVSQFRFDPDDNNLGETASDDAENSACWEMFSRGGKIMRYAFAS
jgi:urease accessory protein